jgi:hypothetical protein
LAADGDGDALAKVEQQIDEVVYRLFELSPDEIAQIENSLAKTRAATLDDDSAAEEE